MHASCPCPATILPDMRTPVDRYAPGCGCKGASPGAQVGKVILYYDAPPQNNDRRRKRMERVQTLLRLTISAAAAVAMGAAVASAQSYPSKPITIVVPAAAGGPTDTVARLVGDSMSRTLGQQIVVENVGGAGGTIGM